MMSIDPASYVAEIPADVMTLESLLVDPDQIYAFDFDGVVSSSKEDDIYHLDTWPGEIELLDKAATHMRVRCQGMEVKYQRHLLYQACAFHLDIEIEPGPALKQIVDASSASRVFILTARSGWYAVERMRSFLKKYHIAPIEVFNIGRIKKDRQVDLLCREFPSEKVYYIEDNSAHLAAVSTLNHPNLGLVLAKRLQDRQPMSDLRTIVNETILTALNVPYINGD